MQRWFMVTLVGKDRIGIVAQVATALYRGGANLGEASMLRMGGNFTIMLMVDFPGGEQRLRDLLAPVAAALGLHVHVDLCEDESYPRPEPDVRISVHGADRAGIVAQVTSALAEAGLNILDLESDVGGPEARPFYVMRIEGQATRGLGALEEALAGLRRNGGEDIEVRLSPVLPEIF